MDDPLQMDELHSVDELAHVETGHLFAKRAIFADDGQELTVFGEIKNKEQRRFVLKGVIKLYDPRMLLSQTMQRLLLDVDVFDLVFFNDVFLGKHLYGKGLFGVDVDRRIHGGIGAFSDLVAKLVVLDRAVEHHLARRRHSAVLVSGHGLVWKEDKVTVECPFLYNVSLNNYNVSAYRYNVSVYHDNVSVSYVQCLGVECPMSQCSSPMSQSFPQTKYQH